MDDVRDLLHQALTEPPEPKPEEEAARRAVIKRLFRVYTVTDTHRAQVYFWETAEIPLTFLAVSVHALIRSRVYPTLPTIGELWTVARKAAGMDRDRYHAGKYIGRPREWPPEGKRYAVTAGEFEALDLGVVTKALDAGSTAPRLEAGT